MFRTTLDQPARELLARLAFNGDPSTRTQADQAVGGTLNVWHPGTPKISVDKRAGCFIRRMQPDHAPHPCYLWHLIGNIAKTYCAVFSTGCRSQTIMARSTTNPGFNLWMALNPTVHALREQSDESNVEAYLAPLSALGPS